MVPNTAAYLTATKASLDIKESPLPKPKEFELVIRTRAVAINPVDYWQQMMGPDVFKWLSYPAILGYDVAGEVEATGSGVTKFKAGDRVAGLTSSGGFQEHVVLSEHMASAIPDSLAYESAAVLPMGVSVATKALFHKDHLNMDLPPAAGSPAPKGQTVLVWGGATSVGSNAIQLATAAGYEVVTTASPHNFDYCRRLGASQVFDYSSPAVKDELVAAFRGKVVAGAVANGGIVPATYPGIVEACAAVVLSTEGSKTLAMTMVPAFPIPEGVEAKFVNELRHDEQLASEIFHGFLPSALAAGGYAVAPEAEVVGKGLNAIQGAMDTLKQGVSAKKIVVAI